MSVQLIHVYAVVVTLVAIALFVLRFKHPYPLIQFPDLGHRLLGVPSEHHNTMVAIFNALKLRPFGTFKAGVRQTLFRDGFTVIASGEGIRSAGISFPVPVPTLAAERTCRQLKNKGIQANIWHPPEPKLVGKLVVVDIPDFGWGIAFRLPGRLMPWPQWEK